MDHDGIVEAWRDRCQRFMENMLQAPDLRRVASASLAIFAPMRRVARDLLQAKITLEAEERRRADVTPCGQEARVTSVPTRTVRPETLLGEGTIPGRTFPCHGWGATVRPDDGPLGVPETGAFTDDVRDLYTPLAAELPHRVANSLFARYTGVPLSSCGGQGSIDRTAAALRAWQAARETRETPAVGEALAAGDGGAARPVEIAMEGVTAHMDGRWQQPKGATLLVRQLATQAEEPTRGAILARRDVCVLGPAEELAVRSHRARQEAGGGRLPIGEILGDGAPWLWKVADADVPGVRQTLDDAHLSEPLSAVAHRRYPNNPAGAKAWVDQHMGALLTDRVGEVLGALKRLRPWEPGIRDALAQLLGYVEHHRTRLRYQAPWPSGLAVGSGAVEGACQHVIHSRFTRAGRRWKQPGFLNVLALRMASRNGTFAAFWASRGLAVQASVAPTK